VTHILEPTSLGGNPRISIRRLQNQKASTIPPCKQRATGDTPRFQAKLQGPEIHDLWGVFKLKKDLYHMIELFKLSKKVYYTKVPTSLDQKLWAYLWSKRCLILHKLMQIVGKFPIFHQFLTTKRTSRAVPIHLKPSNSNIHSPSIPFIICRQPLCELHCSFQTTVAMIKKKLKLCYRRPRPFILVYSSNTPHYYTGYVFLPCVSYWFYNFSLLGIQTTGLLCCAINSLTLE